MERLTGVSHGPGVEFVALEMIGVGRWSSGRNCTFRLGFKYTPVPCRGILANWKIETITKIYLILLSFSTWQPVVSVIHILHN